jgi:hypothetical protein
VTKKRGRKKCLPLWSGLEKEEKGKRKRKRWIVVFVGSGSDNK